VRRVVALIMQVNGHTVGDFLLYLGDVRCRIHRGSHPAAAASSLRAHLPERSSSACCGRVPVRGLWLRDRFSPGCEDGLLCELNTLAELDPPWCACE